MLAERVMETIAATQEVPRDRITLESSFEELGFDSLDGFNLLYAVEEELDVTIPDDVARELRSVGDVVEAVETLLAERRSAGDGAPEGAGRPGGEAVARPPEPGDAQGSAPRPAGPSGSSGS
ncbi:MAG: acyl carrier protein [Thermoanaerobaculia bacterium]